MEIIGFHFTSPTVKGEKFLNFKIFTENSRTAIGARFNPATPEEAAVLLEKLAKQIRDTADRISKE